MTTDSHYNDRSHKANLRKDLQFGNDWDTNSLTGAMDMVKRDRFELLSAYLDGEVTAVERRQVEEWLTSDQTVQDLYGRLLKLRQCVRNLPVPEPQQSPEETALAVMVRLRRRSRIVWVGGGAAVAACVISAMSGLLGEYKIHQLARLSIEQTQPTPDPEKVASPLMVALNNPVIPIPKTAEASPQKSVDDEVHPSDVLDFDYEIN